MKTISKQDPIPARERNAAMTVRQALRSMGVKDFPRNAVGWRGLTPPLSAEIDPAISILKSFGARLELELNSSNDAKIVPDMDGMRGYPGITPSAHQLVISYVSSCQKDRRLIYVSPQISRLGFFTDELLDKPDLRLEKMHEEDIVRFERTLQRSCDTAEKFCCHYRLYDSQGKIRWFHDEASVVCNEAGIPEFIKGVMLDITDRKRMESELENHRYYLERNVELRTEVFAKRLALLELCNSALSARLTSALLEIAALTNNAVQRAPFECEEHRE